MPNQEIKENTTASISLMMSLDLSTISRESDLGKAYSFEAAIEPLSRAKSCFSHFKSFDLDLLGDAELNAIISAATNLSKHVSSIMSFDSTAQGAPEQRTQILNQIQKASNNAFTQL